MLKAKAFYEAPRRQNRWLPKLMKGMSRRLKTLTHPFEKCGPEQELFSRQRMLLMVKILFPVVLFKLIPGGRCV